MKVYIAALAASSSLQAMAFTYFDSQIDYWQPPNQQKPSEAKHPREKAVPAAKPDTTFDWQKFANPRNKEFFKEGDYTPPEPFMELARNPSDENIKQWFALVEAKNQMMGALHKRMAEYVATNSTSLTSSERNLLAEKQVATMPSDVNTKRFRFRLYFDSKCPHCKNMMSTIKEVQELGYYVEVRQTDSLKPEFPIPFPISHATPEELNEKKISSWPVTFIADTEKKVSYRLNGYLPTREVLAIINTK